LRAAYKIVATIDEEELRNTLNIVDADGGRVQASLFANTNPRKGGGLLFPEMFVWVKTYLIDLKALVVVLVVQLAEQQNAGR
jgi:hypothetical protein